MSGKVVLLTPARRFIANHFGVGYQVPLGLVYIGGPLLDAGYSVKLIDNDLYGWPFDRLLKEIAAFDARYVLVGHTGSTAAHAISVQTIRAIRTAFPNIRIVYGGVYPSYADQTIMNECHDIDVIVRGEGEQATLDLINAWENGLPLESVPGITWRDEQGSVQANRAAAPIQDLDRKSVV